MAKCQSIHSAAALKFAEEKEKNSLENAERSGERWKSVPPELAEINDSQINEIFEGNLRIRKRREAIDERERSIVSEALRRQFKTIKEDRDRRADEQQQVKDEVRKT